ncbi:hypothetical protein QKG38_10235 [Clavibacter michiganensis]|uniref:hypothetical protein n=1 Tax=Clavibacter michiganensis TaxID=28447 RepID=UPI00136618F8|nr:hypothetical protein [Clavibacter michiganensis]MDO4018933.1 hypothetical protein [Clavibacter michiganensis]MDO4038390.1 hypothetical protein [Clavibacter michiganensis]MDO4041845.1 hypothetical protein [Clavibacter michiganensis]MDO4050635.1 hypothetical protein [Clavibacter michiganensis]MDO4063100.1 hypothetical protein [Clavibacter michiganensis]
MAAASARPGRSRDRLLVAGAVLCFAILASAALLAAVALAQSAILIDELPPPDFGTATSPEHEALGRRALLAGAVAALALTGGILCVVRRYAVAAATRR